MSRLSTKVETYLRDAARVIVTCELRKNPTATEIHGSISFSESNSIDEALHVVRSAGHNEAIQIDQHWKKAMTVSKFNQFTQQIKFSIEIQW